ncbi:MAG: DUF3375 family protein [Kouleothrix sp.]|jgi:hypothetical protein|nr:DUF3375 family protein [Kouleothrix sp.]
MDKLLWEPNVATVFATMPQEIGDMPDDTNIGALYRQFYVDESRLQRRIETVLETRPACTLAELLDIYPAEKGIRELIGKAAEYEAFGEDVALIRATLPALESWLAANPQHVIEQHGAWPDLLRVCAYFCANPRPNLYIPRAADRRPHQIHRAAQAACWKRCSRRCARHRRAGV